MASYNDFVVKYESGMTIMEIVNQGEISRRTAYRYKAYYDELRKLKEDWLIMRCWNNVLFIQGDAQSYKWAILQVAETIGSAF